MRIRRGYPVAGRAAGCGVYDASHDRHRSGRRTTSSSCIRASVIGDDEAVAGPFGIRRVTYADYTASGRALAFIEDYLRDAVLPLYANTHTESSGTGLQTTRFREEARRIIRDSVGGADDHAVIFCGSGMTAAVNKLVDVLNLRIPNDLDDRYALRSHIPADERPLIFIGPYEHHSNELPWRESIGDVVTISEDADGRIDLAMLERALESTDDRPLRIGSFSAASNVTGILSDTRAISIQLHRHGALSFWDFAAAGPYVEIEMSASPARRPDAELDYKDAIVLSPHKFIGGPGHAGRPRRATRALPQPRPGRTGRRDRRVRQPPGARLPRRPGASRRGRHAGDHRIDPGGSGVPAQGAGGRRADPRPRGGLHRPRDGELGLRAGDRAARQPGPAAPVDRVVHDPPRRSVSPPQLRRRPAQRPVRDPVARRLLVRRAVRSSAARHRHRDVARLRARDLTRLRGHQARLGPGELQLLHQRGDVRLHRRGGRARGTRRLAAPARGTASTRRRACGGTAPARPSRRCRCTTSTTTGTACAIRRTAIASPSRGLRTTWPRRPRSSRIRPPCSGRHRTPSRSRSGRTSSRFAGSGCPTRWALAAAQ